jgi:hypothetical protein
MLSSTSKRVVMIDKETAKQLVVNRINIPASRLSTQDEMIVLDDCTIEKEFGWVFFWDSKLHQQTGDFKHTLAGNAPIIVNKNDDSLHITGTAYPIDHYIREYEDKLERDQQKWALVIKDDPKESLEMQRKLREALGLSLREMAELKTKIPGTIAKGAKRDLIPKYEALIKHGISAEIKESVQIEGRI